MPDGLFHSGLVLADDATGALECASLLAGLGCPVTLRLAPGSGEGVEVVDTESRHLPAEQAAARVREWLRPGVPVFKKTDSTLRGNIAAELGALLGDGPVVYLPAYPALGRTVRGGRLFVSGVPVNETEFARDARQPVREAGIADLFTDLTENIPDAPALATALARPERRVLICDAETAADLDAYVPVLRSSPALPALAGPAGFIPRWAELAGFPAAAPPAIPRPEKWLVVCGSRHPVSRRQAAFAEAAGIAVVKTPDAVDADPAAIAAALADRAAAAIETLDPGGIVIMGGDTVWALWRALGITSVTPLPEILPGIAASLSPDRRRLFVTKAGGFGDDSLLDRILERTQTA